MLKTGDIGFSSNLRGGLGGFFASAIRFFTKSKYSHTLMISDDTLGAEAVQEAGVIVQVVPFDKYYRHCDKEIYKMYRPKAPEEVKAQSAKKVFVEFAGVTYGKLQLIWFIYRAVMENVFKKDVRSQKNWMTDGVICSELVYWYLWNLGEPYQSLLKPWNPDTIQAQDILNIVEANPDLFELVEAKDKV